MSYLHNIFIHFKIHYFYLTEISTLYNLNSTNMGNKKIQKSVNIISKFLSSWKYSDIIYNHLKVKRKNHYQTLRSTPWYYTGKPS